MFVRAVLAAAVCAVGCSASSAPEPPGSAQPAGGTAPGGGGAGAVPPAGGNAAAAASPGLGGGFVGVEVTDAATCAKDSYVSDLLPSNILFLVDRSGSMNCNLDVPSAECEENPQTGDPSAPTKWSVITGAVDSALTTLTGAPNINVGLSLFSNNDECGVRSAPNVDINLLTASQHDALVTGLGGVSPRGGTPIVGATVLAYKHLHEEAQAPGNRFVVIVTDGADSCLDRYAEQGDLLDRLLNTEMPKAQSVNIRTFVIGAPGSEGARGLLSRMAWAGGTSRSPDCDHSGDDTTGNCHFDMTESTNFGADLAVALDQITGRAALTCEFEIPTSANDEVDPSKVNVNYFRGGMEKVELVRDDAPCDAGANGWQYLDAERTRIQVCGALCDEIRADPDGRVDIELGCETRVAR